MKIFSSNKSKIVLIAILFIAGSIFVGVTQYMRITGSEGLITMPTPAYHAPSSGKPGGPGHGAASFPIDFYDNRRFVGFYQNIFAAKIVEEISSVPRPSAGSANIQYEAEAIYNVKGNVQGEITIDFDAMTGDRLMVGTTYLFGTIHTQNLGPWYYVGFHPAMKTAVTEDSSLSTEQLEVLVRRNQRTYELLKAYLSEIPYEGNVARDTNYNAFQSLSEAEKQDVFAKFGELIPSRPVPEILPPPPPPPPPTSDGGTACVTNVDQDGDGLVGKNDPDCSRYYREDLPSFCKDYEDNDRDGLTDSADPDCAPFYPQPAPPPPPPPPPAPPPAPTSTPPVAPPPPAQASSSTASSTNL